MDKFDANSIEYKDLLMIYRDEITPYIYRYTLVDDKIITLIFKEEHFCKLLALDEFAPSLYKRREYLDRRGIEKIECGEISSIELKKQKPKIWRTYKNRVEYFVYLKELLSNPQYIIFNQSIANTKIEADVILLYRLSESEYIHLFCRNIGKHDVVLKPITFVIHKNNKYVAEQDIVLIKEIHKDLIKE